MANSITVFRRQDLCVHGKELRLQRLNNRLTIREVCRRMNQKGWGYYVSKLYRLERESVLCRPASEIMDLLESINTTADIK